MKYPFSDIYGERTRFGSKMPMTDPSQMARDWMGQASGTYGRIQAGQKTKTKGPGHTAGGGVQAAAGGAVAGASSASLLGSMGVGAAKGSTGGWWGAAIGAAIGLGAYLFS